MDVAPSLFDFRIGEGGLLRRFEIKTHLTRLWVQILISLAVTWVPVMLLGIIHQLVTGEREPLIRLPAVHVRLLVAVPVLLTLDHVFPRISRIVIHQLVTQSFVPDSARPRLEALLRKATRMADAVLPEFLIALLGICMGAATLTGHVAIGGLGQAPRTAGQIWYSLADWPFVQFLLWRSMWRWLIWARIVIGISKIELNLVPTHPDRMGGIRFIRWPSMTYCALLLFVVSSALSAEWGARFTWAATFAGFKPFLAAFAVVGGTIAFGPLLFFTPQMGRARLRGLIESDRLASDQNRQFGERWVAADGARDFLQAPDVQSLNNLIQMYRETVLRMRYVLVEKYDVLWLLVATLVPVIPVMLLHIPAENWREILELFTGARLR
jgi:hypothetical protein